MKSLEIVRDKLYILEKYPAKIEAVKLEKDVLINQEQLLKIEQELEALEIIRKKDVNLATLKLCIMRTDTIEQLLSKYNKSRYFTQDELTLEELLKLKQWFEENEND